MGKMKTSCDRWASAEAWVQMGMHTMLTSLILMCCTLIFPIHIYKFSLSLHLSFIFIFPLLHTTFIFTSRFFPVLSQYICPLPLSPSLWLKFSLPDWKVSSRPKTEKRWEAASPFVARQHLPNGWRRLNPDVLACSRYQHPAQCSLPSLQLGKICLKCSASPVSCLGPGRCHRRPCEFGSPTWDWSTALPFHCPISSQRTSEDWTAYFPLSQHLFSATHLAPPEQREAQWFGTWLLAGDLFACG